MACIKEITQLYCNFVQENGDYEIYTKGKNTVKAIWEVENGVFRVEMEGDSYVDIYHPSQVWYNKVED